MPNGSIERFENALAFQRELVAVVDKWASRIETSDGDAFVKELLGYFRIRRMLADSADHVESARGYDAVPIGAGEGGKVATLSTKGMVDLSSKTEALMAATSTGVTLACIASDKARMLASRK
jgi:hypothetical protein